MDTENIEYFGYALILLSSILLLLSLFRRQDTFFNLRIVFIEHLSLFNHCRMQYLIFYVYPLIMSIGISLIYVADNDFYEKLDVIISILISVLLTILSILPGKDYSNLSEEQQRRIKQVLHETNNAIIFDVCLCIFLMTLSMIMSISETTNMIICQIVSGVTCYVFLVILLNLLLIVKRMGKLLQIN